MQINHLQDLAINRYMIVLGDIHINTKLSYEFEEHRLEALAKKVKGVAEHTTVILAGDTFDRNTPALTDIKLFYKFIEDLGCLESIYVINGNHDKTTFSFIPERGFTYLPTATIINNKFMLVPWSELVNLMTKLESSVYPELTLISHARCTIAPYITEEVSIATLASSFKEVILGDIHSQPELPFDNVRYTTSPSNVSFTTLDSRGHGFQIIDLLDMKIRFIPITIPTKVLINCATKEEAENHLKKVTKKIVYRKIRFRGTAEEIRELSRYSPPYTVKDFMLSTENINTTITEDADKLTEFLSCKSSLTDFAFKYFKDTLTVKDHIVENIRQSYEAYRTTKGSHK